MGKDSRGHGGLLALAFSLTYVMNGLTIRVAGAYLSLNLPISHIYRAVKYVDRLGVSDMSLGAAE